MFVRSEYDRLREVHGGSMRKKRCQRQREQNSNLKRREETSCAFRARSLLAWVLIEKVSSVLRVYDVRASLLRPILNFADDSTPLHQRKDPPCRPLVLFAAARYRYTLVLCTPLTV